MYTRLVVSIQYSNTEVVGSIPCNVFKQCHRFNHFWEADESSFFPMYWSPKPTSFTGNVYKVHLDLPFCEKMDFLPSASHDHGGGGGILRQFSPLLPAIEGVLDSPRPTVLNKQSGAGPVCDLGRWNAHFLSNIDQRRQPQCCSGNELN